MEQKALLKEIINVLDQKMANDIVCIKIPEINHVLDYVVICTAQSTTHARSLAGELEKKIAELGEEPPKVEGEQFGNWVLTDFNGITVNIFLEDTRKFYDLERIWVGGTNIPINEI